MKNLYKIAIMMIFIMSLSGCGNTDKDTTPPIIDIPVAETPAIDTPTENATFVLRYASEDVNIREGKGIDSAIIKVIFRGEAVEVYGETDGWSKVKSGNLEGYVKASYLVKDKPVAYEERALEILKTMSIEEKVGQMFFVRCRKDTAEADLEKYYLGGYILFDEDLVGQTKDTIKAHIESYQKSSKIKLLIGIDEEGGIINRLSKYTAFRKVPFHSPQALYDEGGYPLIISDTKEKAALLKSLGININLAPVSDVSTDSADYIYARTFGKNAQETAEYVKTVVETMNESKMGATLKHFPGYGNNVDTHTGIAMDERSYDSFVKSDFLPFQAGIDAGVGSILVSHNIVKPMDENLPASLSPKVHNILREELKFNGVIMTDDLKMDAIKKYIGDEASAVLAIQAGNDLIIATNFDVQIPSVLLAIKNGTITEKRLDESLMRILLWKLKLAIIS
ncbi:MAG: glycoside hydrolase family 3 N-terminal domain-containing protein [Clostridiaceae bacterium]